jgi:plastocyanin
VTPRKTLPALAAVAAAAAVLAGCGGNDSAGSPQTSTSASSKPAAAASAVTISGFKFHPASLSARQGASLRITNGDSTAHTATADDGKSFATGPLDPGASKTIRLSKPGSYAYHCSIHSFMKGTIVVR